MTAISSSRSRLSAPDPRPIVVTIAAVGFFLIFGLGGLNALVVLLNGSSRVTLMESPPPPRPPESLEFGSQMMGEVPNPELIVLGRVFAGVYIAVASAGIVGGIGLLRRRSWSRAVLWAAAGGAVAVHALYTFRILQIQTAEIANVFERQEIFELVGTTSAINVAIQSIPLAVLVGLLRHPGLRRYVFGSSDAPTS